MEVRAATKNDADKILLLYDEFVAYVDEVLDQQPVITSYQSRLKKLLEFLKTQQQGIFVIQDGNDLIGFCSYMILSIVRRDYNCLHIEDFFITKGYRRLGFGKMLFQEISNFAIANNLPIIDISTNLKMTEAQEFYQKMGGDFDGQRYTFNLVL